MGSALIPGSEPSCCLTPGEIAGTRLRHEDALLVLDRFGEQLAACEPAAEQLRLLLTTLQTCLDADAIYIWSATSAREFDIVGRKTLLMEWCREWARDLLHQAPGTDSQLVRSNVCGLRSKNGELPRSVAMLRLSRSRSTWVVALNFSDQPLTPGDINIMALARRILWLHRRNQMQRQRLTGTMLGLFRSLTIAIDDKDRYTRGHSERVAELAVRLGQELRLPAAAISDLRLAGLVHDIGKIGISESVLQKPSPLDEFETAEIRRHAALGDRIVAGLASLKHIRPVVRHHHERYDGGGYPDGLGGKGIPLLARIVSLADAFDAMLSDRPYRQAMSADEVDATIVAGAGTQWDPRIVSTFLSCRPSMHHLRTKLVQYSPTIRPPKPNQLQ